MVAPVMRKRRGQRADWRCSAVALAKGIPLGRRSQARAREEPATEALIIVAIRCPRGTILRACFCHQVANLAGGCGKRAVMMVRLVARHFGNQAFEIVSHAVLP